MLSLLSALLIAQANPTQANPEIVHTQEVRSLPGQLNSVPVFNSNSPEWVKQEGILLSTFPLTDKQVPAAHLNFEFEGKFDIFAHHFTNAVLNGQPLYLGILVENPGSEPVTIKILEAASYLVQPDAPYIDLPAFADNTANNIHAGPGDRAMSDVLRGLRQAGFPEEVIIPPGESTLLLNHPIPIQGLEPPTNGRSSLMRVESDGKVYVASMAMFGKVNADGTGRSPTLAEWQQMLQTSGLAGPRDRVPTPPEQTTGQLIYGRVAGVSEGSEWQGQLTDRPDSNDLTIPTAGNAFSYAIATVRGGTLGTNQVQTAKMLVRYPDTAYEAHGNYAVSYDLSLPLYNPTDSKQTVTLAVQTPMKENQLSQGGLRFRKTPVGPAYFRNTIRVRYSDNRGESQTRYVHLWHRRGQPGEPLVTLELPPGDRKLVEVDFFYPPDSTPPQVLTVKTLEQNQAGFPIFLVVFGIGTTAITATLLYPRLRHR